LVAKLVKGPSEALRHFLLDHHQAVDSLTLPVDNKHGIYQALTCRLCYIQKDVCRL